jgi:nicotinate-nucleotide adenylyltransferase
VRLGILGGTFDPPHTGHLLAATDAYERLALDRLVLVPAKTQPLKIGAVQAEPTQRLEMLERLVAGDDRFRVDPVEIDRPGLSYTVDTLAHFAERYPDARRFFLIGEDLVMQFPHWREPERIAALAEVVVLARLAAPDAAQAPTAHPMTVIATRRVDISSTEIRERVREGKPIRGFVPDAVADYIRSAGLYR